MTQQFNQPERELDWNDEIVQDSTEFVQLNPGDYQFTVTNFERARHTPNPNNPNSKLPACNKAVITIQIETAEGLAQLTHNLFLHTSTEGMLSAFFGAIGQKKHGEPCKPNWSAVIGSKGVARIGKRKGTGQYADREYDDVKSMIYADDVDWTKVLNAQAPAQSAYQAPPQQPYQQPQTSQQPTYQPQAPGQQPYQQPQAPQQPAGQQTWGRF